MTIKEGFSYGGIIKGLKITDGPRHVRNATLRIKLTDDITYVVKNGQGRLVEEPKTPAETSE
jgi:hypothetical protein